MAKDSDNTKDEMVYIVVKDESKDEEDEMSFVSHFSKNNIWMINNGCSHHMTREKKII